jgi:hypothetical protein
MNERVMPHMDWWFLDKNGRLFMSIGHSATHIKKGDGDFFLRRWFHKVDTKRIFISMEEQKKMGLKRITRKEARKLKELNDEPCVKEYQNRMNDDVLSGVSA